MYLPHSEDQATEWEGGQLWDYLQNVSQLHIWSIYNANSKMQKSGGQVRVCSNVLDLNAGSGTAVLT